MTNQQTRPTEPDTDTDHMSPVLAGPILRHTRPDTLVLWLAASRPLDLQVRVSDSESDLTHRPVGKDELTCLRVGTRAWLHLLHIPLIPFWPV